MSTSSTSRPRKIATVGFAACLAAGVAAMAFGAGATTTAAPEPEPVATVPAARAEALPASVPTRITIPRIDVSAKVVELRAAKDGKTLALPPLKQTGWDATSASPGQVGIAVITGYIARSAKEPGALEDLRKLREGDRISVRRTDTKLVSYRVTGVDYYAQGKFPAQAVFPQTQQAELRLISTGGALRQGDPLGNAVVTAVAE
jgi:Sortase domain